MNLLLISTASCILEYLAPILIKYIIVRFYEWRKYDINLKNELISMRQEMAGISMVNEFSTYAKLQRKYNKLEAVLKQNIAERSSYRMKLQLSIIYRFRLLNGFLMLFLLYTYNKEVVISFPQGTVSPIASILCWPTQHENSISLIMWLIIARLTVSTWKKVDIM